jgi:DNA-binding MarR family transcriptional regulator
VEDVVDRVVREWAAELPDLPVAPIEVVTRVGRLRARFDDELAGLFARFDLSAADFAVIAALRRAGSPYRLPQSVLMTRLGLTSGTISVRLTRLVAKDVVERSPSPDDARGTLITLTGKGLRLFDDVAPAHLENEDLLLSALTADEREQLAGLLRKLLIGFEHERTRGPWGLTLASAHIARRMRTSVGLSDTPGLLVLGISPETPDVLQAGDLLVAVDGVELRSCAALAEHAAGVHAVEIQLLRGADPHTLAISPG